METITYQNEIINYVIVKRGTKNLYARMDDDNVVKLSYNRYAYYICIVFYNKCIFKS